MSPGVGEGMAHGGVPDDRRRGARQPFCFPGYMALLLSHDVWVEICDWAGNARCCNALSLVCRDLWGLLHKRHQYGVKRQLDCTALHIHQWVKWCGNQVSSPLYLCTSVPLYTVRMIGIVYG